MSYEDNFIVYGPYLSKDTGRKIVIVKSKKDGTKRTMTYPRWLLEVHMEKPLDSDLTVDHWDSNHTNDSIDNFKLFPRSEHSSNDTRRVKLVKFKCKWCDKDFERSPRLIRDKSKKDKAGPFCSRPCAGKYSRKVQLKLIDPMEAQPMIESEYYKKKYASAINDMVDIYIDFCCDVWEE